jgi:hypothetical protein
VVLLNERWQSTFWEDGGLEPGSPKNDLQLSCFVSREVDFRSASSRIDF